MYRKIKPPNIILRPGVRYTYEGRISLNFDKDLVKKIFKRT